MSEKLMMTASDVADVLGVSVGHAYKIIKKLNVELEQGGYLVIAGKCLEDILKNVGMDLQVFRKEEFHGC